MISRLRILVLFLLLSVEALLHAGEGNRLRDLDEALEKRGQYEKMFLAFVADIQKLKDAQTSDNQIYEVNQRLIEAYSTYSFDKTRDLLQENADIARRLNDSYRMVETDMRLVLLLQKAGFYAGYREILDKYREEDIPQGLLLNYYNNMRIASNEYMQEQMTHDTYESMRALREMYTDKMLEMVPEDSMEYLQLMYEKIWRNNSPQQARPYAAQMIEKSRDNMRDYAMACYQYSRTFEDDMDTRVEYLVESAIADAMAATRDYASLSELVNIFFDQGDVDLAFKYGSKYCLPDALAYNGKLRPMQLSLFFPQVQAAYEQIRQKRSKQMTAMLLTLLMLMLAVGRMSLSVYKRNRELERIRKNLHNSNLMLQKTDKVKKEYITLFLTMLSENISTDRKYKNHVLKYLRNGNAQDIQKEIEQLPPLEKDINRFYGMFDETFVNIFPSFKDKFNALLREECRHEPKGSDVLTPEMRVFALIKLGIKDSGKIASLLHYSANTVYNYRAKIKNSALVDRDRFEDMLDEI